MSASKKLPETRNVGSEKRNVVNTPGFIRFCIPKIVHAAVYSFKICSIDTVLLMLARVDIECTGGRSLLVVVASDNDEPAGELFK